MSLFPPQKPKFFSELLVRLGPFRLLGFFSEGSESPHPPIGDDSIGFVAKDLPVALPAFEWQMTCLSVKIV